MSSKSIWARLPPQVGVGRRQPVFEMLQRLEAEVAHPLRLVLVLGDRFDHLAGEALGRLVGVARLGIVEAELLLVVGVDPGERLFLRYDLGCCHVNRPPG